jgi:hypothetical protein
MEKRDLAGVLVRAIGVYIVASAIPFCVTTLVNVWWTISANKMHLPDGRSVLGAVSQGLVAALLQLAVGLVLFYGGGTVARKLIQLDEQSKSRER